MCLKFGFFFQIESFHRLIACTTCIVPFIMTLVERVHHGQCCSARAVSRSRGRCQKLIAHWAFPCDHSEGMCNAFDRSPVLSRRRPGYFNNRNFWNITAIFNRQISSQNICLIELCLCLINCAYFNFFCHILNFNCLKNNK